MLAPWNSRSCDNDVRDGRAGGFGKKSTYVAKSIIIGGQHGKKDIPVGGRRAHPDTRQPITVVGLDEKCRTGFTTPGDCLMWLNSYDLVGSTPTRNTRNVSMCWSRFQTRDPCAQQQ